LPVLALLLAVWLRRRGRRETPAAAAPPMSNSLPCPECGKMLRARAELGGKRVKCVQCGRPVLVPGTAPPGAGPPAPARVGRRLALWAAASLLAALPLLLFAHRGGPAPRPREPEKAS